MLSMISSPELPFLLHSITLFLQLVGVSIFLTSEADEVKEISAVAKATTKALRNSRFIFFMVVVLQFDESIRENVTVNLNIVLASGNGLLMNSTIRAMECLNKLVNCIGEPGLSGHPLLWLYLPQTKPYERKTGSAHR